MLLRWTVVVAAWCVAGAGAWQGMVPLSAPPLAVVGSRFSSRPFHMKKPQARRGPELCMGAATGEWEKMGGGKMGDAVCRRLLEQGDGEIAQPGCEVQVEYVGTIAAKDWTVDDVLECWLESQVFRAPFGVVPREGQYYAEEDMKMYGEALAKHSIDSSKLLSGDFTETFVEKTLGVSNKMHSKKLANAARKLQGHLKEFETGMEFDSSKDEGPLTFVLGDGKVGEAAVLPGAVAQRPLLRHRWERVVNVWSGGQVIKGWDMCIAGMSEGDKSLFRIRSDYGYGKDGFRRRGGQVVVPPFATLEFEVKLLKVSPPPPLQTSEAAS